MTKGNTASPGLDPAEADIVGTRAVPSGSGRLPERQTGSVGGPHPAKGKGGATVRARRRDWGKAVLLLVPVLCAVLLGGAAWAYGNSQPPSFTSEALVSVLPTDPTNPISTGATALWVQIGDSDQMRREAATRIGVTPEELDGAVEISQAGDAALISVAVTTDSGARSADWANGFAEALEARGNTNFVAGYDLQQVTSALPAQAAAGLTPLLVVAAPVLGFLIGLAIVQVWARRGRRHATTGSASA